MVSNQFVCEINGDSFPLLREVVSLSCKIIFYNFFAMIEHSMKPALQLT